MHFGTLTLVWVLSLSDIELTPYPHSRHLWRYGILSLTGQLGVSPLDYPISSFTPIPTSGEAELRHISGGTSYHPSRLASNRKTALLYLFKPSSEFSPLVPGHPSDLNLSTGSEPPSRFPGISPYPGLDRQVSGPIPVTWALSHPSTWACACVEFAFAMVTGINLATEINSLPRVSKRTI